MEDKFNDTYRTQTVRARWHDYVNGAYFVTICTYHHRHYFGAIKDELMYPSELGKFAEQCWNEIPIHFPLVELGPFILMPNHIHGIIQVAEKQDTMVSESPVQYGTNSDSAEQQFGSQSLNLASVVRGFKIGVTKYATQHNLPFKWQPRYYDHIIRDQYEWDNIAEYINNNVSSWDIDKLNIIDD